MADQSKNFSIKPSDISGDNSSLVDVNNPASTLLQFAGQQKKSGSITLWKKKISNKDLVFFTREFSILLSASVPIVQALNILSKQLKNNRFRRIVEDVSADVEGGMPLSQALARYPAVFSNLFVSLVQTGEASGTLGQTLVYIADQSEKDYELRRKVKSALTYPVFVLVVMFGVLGLLFTFVIPKMLVLLSETDAKLPFTTTILIFVTNLATTYWWAFLLIVSALILSYRLIISNPVGRVWTDNLKLKIPLVGPILQRIYLERFARNFAVLIQGGLPVVKSLHITAEAVSNAAYRQTILAVADSVENGQSISQSLSDHPQKIPTMIVEMVDIGEKTSRIDEILGRVASFYSRETEHTMEGMTQLLEPVIMVLLGGVVAIIVSGILLPIYSLINAQ